LVISKKLVEKMGGAISLESAPGEGSHFYFDIKANRDFEALIEHEPEVNFLEEKRVFLYLTLEKSRLAIEHMLQRWSMQVRSAAEMDEFVRIVEHATNSHKTIDYLLVDCSDFETYHQEIKHLFNLARTQLDCAIIAILASPDAQQIAKLKILGAHECLSRPIAHQQLKHALQELLDDDQRQGLLSDQTEPESQFDALNILAVDDNEANLKLLSVFLDEYKVNVFTAENGAQAVELARQHPFDLIFMDIQMPEMDGVEATRRIRKLRLNQRTPIIALTAHAIMGEREKLLSEGMNDYLTKPIGLEQIEETLLKWTQSRSQIKRKTVASHTDSVISPSDHQSKQSPTSTVDAAIDWKLSIKMAGGKEELAKDMIQMLIQHIPQARDEINTAKMANSLDELLRVVHKFHGATCYVGVPRLTRCAKNYETHLKTHGLKQDVENLHQQLMAEMERVERFFSEMA
jgi:two-component system sensor histidine kinase BarA